MFNISAARAITNMRSMLQTLRESPGFRASGQIAQKPAES
jgi:hypothetical protein